MINTMNKRNCIFDNSNSNYWANASESLVVQKMPKPYSYRPILKKETERTTTKSNSRYSRISPVSKLLQENVIKPIHLNKTLICYKSSEYRKCSIKFDSFKSPNIPNIKKIADIFMNTKKSIFNISNRPVRTQYLSKRNPINYQPYSKKCLQIHLDDRIKNICLEKRQNSEKRNEFEKNLKRIAIRSLVVLNNTNNDQSFSGMIKKCNGRRQIKLSKKIESTVYNNIK